MCLTLLLHEWCLAQNKKLSALTVDHTLRAGSKKEGQRVKIWLGKRGIHHEILTWSHGEITSNIQDQARRARYALMTKWCKENNISQLFLAHHADDQAENFFIRLQRGSGLYGLSGIKPSEKREGVSLLRPFLKTYKNQIIATLQEMQQEWIEDPSNQNEDFLRIKMRQLLATHSEELPQDRVLLAMKNLTRSKEAIEYYVNQAWHKLAQESQHQIKIPLKELYELPEEVTYRILTKALMQISQKNYGPRLNSLESLFIHFKEGNTQGKTLHDCIINIQDNMLAFSPEK